MTAKQIRNIAIVAHVDHGKTTLVDSLFRFAGTFRKNQLVQERAMDSDAQERERGITILAKNTAVDYRGWRINIVDTPGHADFGGQVERTLRMADAVLLLVDAAEGPMPQTRFVLRKAFENGLKAMVMINKIDRPDARVAAVLDMVLELFIELGASDEQLDFPVVYGSGRDGYAKKSLSDENKDMEPLFDMILTHAPQPPTDDDAPVQFQAATLDHDDFLGRIAIGRIRRGTLKNGARVAVCHPDREKAIVGPIKGLFRYEGLTRVPAETVGAGDIAVVAHAEFAEAEVKQGGFGFFDLREQFGRHGGAIRNARGEAGSRRFVPVRQSESLGGFADVLFGEAELMQRAQNVQLTSGGAAGSHIERVLGVHAVENVFEALPLIADQVLGGHLEVLEQQLGGGVVQHGPDRPDGQAIPDRLAHVDQQDAHAVAGPGGLLPGRRAAEEHHQVRMLGPADPDLRPVDHILVAHTLRERLYPRRVRTARRLGHAKRL
jgi:small GTP-binding protein